MLLLFALGCEDPTYPTCEEDTDLPALAEAPTWHRDVRPLVEASCTSCHVDGGIGGFALQDYASAAAMANAMATAVTTGTMPPWPPADCCTPLRHSLALSPQAVATFAAWAEGGAPEGDPGDYVAPEVPTNALPRVDLTLEMPEPYTPDPLLGSDDTRCFLLDWPEDEARYVTGLAVHPGEPGEVHHAVLLVAGPSTVASFEATDALDEAPGWACPGGLVFGYTGWIGGWSPGWTAREMPEGTGQLVEPGSKLLLTVHYSIPDGEPVADQTSVELMIEEEVDAQLDALAVYDPQWVGGLWIPANDPDVVETATTWPATPRTLYGVNLHMHERGSRGSVGILRGDGTRECLLQIDEWEHDWQGDYLFEDPVELGLTDSLWVECHWDNTSANQRIVDGEPEEPRDLVWAEDQEMCVAYVTARGLL